jgi:hypothetical protein
MRRPMTAPDETKNLAWNLACHSREKGSGTFFRTSPDQPAVGARYFAQKALVPLFPPSAGGET